MVKPDQGIWHSEDFGVKSSLQSKISIKILIGEY